MIRIGIVGAGRGGSALLRTLHGKDGIEIAGIADSSPDAPGLQLARRYGIPVSLDARDLLKTAPPHLLLDATGDPGAIAPLKSLLPPETELLSGSAAWLLRILSREQDHLCTVLQEARDGVLTVDSRGRIIFWNREAELLLGYHPEEILGQTFQRLLPPRHRQEGKEIRALLEDRECIRDYESELVTADGTKVQVNGTLTAVRDREERTVGLTAAFRDAGESRRVVRERASYYGEPGVLNEISRMILGAPQLRDLLEGILNKVILLGPFDLGVIHLLDLEERALVPVASRGYREAEHVRFHYRYDPSAETEKAARVLTYRHARVEENVPECDGLRTFKKEGVQSAVVVPVRAREKVVGALQLGSRRPHKFSAGEIHLLEAIGEQLGIAVQKTRLYEKTLKAYERLKKNHRQMIQVERLRALGELASGVAHDFNNLLTAILGRTEVLLELTTDPEVRRNLEVIHKAAMDGACTVRRVQEFAGVKDETGHAVVDLSAVIADVVEFTANRWEKEARTAGVSITICNETRDLPAVQGNAAQLREVFTNLVLNAVDAMPAGGTLTLRGRTKGGILLVEVSDTGVGMTPEVRKRVFEPFFTTKKNKGTGLGLSIAEGIIQRHGGTVTVRSEPGQGTTFRIQFPVFRPTATAEPQALPQDLRHAAGVLSAHVEDSAR